MPAFVRALFIKSSTEVELSYCTKKQAHQVSLLHVPAALWNGLFYVLNSANKNKVWQNFEFFLSFLTKIHAVLNGLKRSKTLFLPCFFYPKCTKKPLKHWILAVFQIWTWGESNPCPKAYSFRHLPLQSFYWGFPRRHAGWQACRFGSFIKSSISAKLWKRSTPHLFDARRIAAENYSADNAALRQRTLRNYRLRLNLGSRLMTRSRSPRMASQTSKPPSKPVQALTYYMSI